MLKKAKLIEIALSQYGIMEIRGAKDNPEIIKYFDALGFDGKALKDETSWCCAFVNWVCLQAGIPQTGTLNARSWEDKGVKTTSPELGDLAVFWRGKNENDCIAGTNLKKGHVAFYIKEDKDSVYVLGGNQSNMVCISAYPKSRLLTYRSIT